MPRVLSLHPLLLIACTVIGARFLAGQGPQPGDIYREYVVNLKVKDNWRVTDPVAGHPGAAEFLPNPDLGVDISSLDGAVRAEALIDRWGGHAGTSSKRIRFNGNGWLPVPELETTPAGESPECYQYQDNPIIEIPLEHLKEGHNKFEGTCGGQVCYSFDWGQWGWYSLVLRVYYGKELQHPMGRIVSPGAGSKLQDFPVVKVEASSPVGVAQVDVLGRYEGFDVDGDGEFAEWQRYYSGTSLTSHVGSAHASPWTVTWNTRWVPDQSEGAVGLVARIMDNAGVWFVTDEVRGLSLVRETVSVKMYRPHDVPAKFTVRAGKKMSCDLEIPAGSPLYRAIDAAVHLRTWNGTGENFVINGQSSFPIGGNNHFYRYNVVEIPPSVLVTGTNNLSFTSATEHHGPEILWPGPVVIVRYRIQEK